MTMEKRERLHIVSLGTSILSNLKALREKYEEFGEIPKLGPDLEDWLKKRREDKELHEKAYQALVAEPYRLSAELNGMMEFLDNGEVDQVYLIATDTEAGRFCDELLSRFFRERKIEVMSSGPLLGYYKADKALGERLGPDAASAVFSDDLHILFNNLIGLIRYHKVKMGKEVLINATGGFKAEMSVLSLAGNLFLVRTYYRHESFQKAVFLPPLIPPEVFPDELVVLRRIYEKPEKRIVGKEFQDLYTEKKEVVDRLVDFRVLEILSHHETDIEYGVELTPQGKFWVEIGKKLESDI